jgi:hypothetical protein
MRRLLCVFLVAAACGGSKKSTTPPPPLPEPKAEAKPEPPKEEAKPAEPPVPQGPVELTLPAPKVTVKLVNGGKGKKAPLKLAAKAGDKQSVELTLDFSGKQTVAGTETADVAPTVVLLADVEAKEVGTDGTTKFQLTISGIDARDVAGARNTGAEFKEELKSLTGATIAGAVNANGSISDLVLRVEKPDAKTLGAMELVGMSLMPMWPILPTEAIAPGAKWQVTQTAKVAGRLEVTHTIDYQLISKKGKAWAIKGSTKVSGTDQEIEKAKFGSISGSGSSEATINEGALLPLTKQSVKTDFVANVEPQPNQKVSLSFHLEQANGITPKQ